MNPILFQTPKIKMSLGFFLKLSKMFSVSTLPSIISICSIHPFTFLNLGIIGSSTPRIPNSWVLRQMARWISQRQIVVSRFFFGLGTLVFILLRWCQNTAVFPRQLRRCKHTARFLFNSASAMWPLWSAPQFFFFGIWLVNCTA